MPLYCKFQSKKIFLLTMDVHANNEATNTDKGDLEEKQFLLKVLIYIHQTYFVIQVCIKLDQPIKCCFGFGEKCYDLYHYNDNKIGKKFHAGQISTKKVKKAREALKVW